MEPSQLTPFDASFLALDGPKSVGHVSLLLPFEGDASLDQLTAQLTARLHLAPILRRRLRFSKLSLGRPWWIDDDQFDLAAHLSVADLSTLHPQGGSQADLLAEAVRVSRIPLDRSRPLWAMHLIRGLAEGRGALVARFHHAAADGVGIRDLLGLLFGTDDEPSDDSYTPDWQPEPGPNELTRLASGIAGIGHWVSTTARLDAQIISAVPTAMLRATHATANRVAEGLERFVNPSTTPMPFDPTRVGSAPGTPFNAPITVNRSWAFASLPIAASRTVRRATGTSANDVLVAAVAGALRHWFQAHDALPDSPLVALVPVAAREAGEGGNQFALSLVPVPTHLDTPADRLVFAHTAMGHAKTEPTFPTRLLGDAMEFAGQPVASMVTHWASRLHLADVVHLPFNLMVSNVPAPQQQLRIGADAPVSGVHPFPPLSDGLGLTICTQGYGGDMAIGIGSCPDLLPDPDRLRDWLVDEYQALVALVQP